MITEFYDCYNVLNKVYGEGTYISQAISSTTIEPLRKKFIVKLCYGVLDKDIELSYYITKLSNQTPKKVVRTLLKIAMYAILYLNKQPYTVVNSTVELAKKLGKGGMSGFINAFLRNFNSKKIDLPTEEYEYLSVKYSYPLFAIKLLEKTFGKDEMLNIIASDEEHSFVRFAEGFDGESYLKTNEINYCTTPFSDLFDVKGLTLNDEFAKGNFTFQSIGSRAICEIAKKCLIENKSKNLLDACAAPGGKTVYLSKFVENVVALEKYEHRVELINSYAKRMKISNIQAKNEDSTVHNEEYRDKFDLVLCDVPCSGFGTLKDNPDIKLKKELSDVFSICQTQIQILSNCASYVKNNGVLIYSTCSIFSEENDEIINKFLSKNKNFVVEQITSPLDSLKMKNGLQFLPNLSFGAGFYVCKLRKV